MEIKKYCMVIELKEEFIDKYYDIHRNPWPELLEAIKGAGAGDTLDGSGNVQALEKVLALTSN